MVPGRRARVFERHSFGVPLAAQSLGGLFEPAITPGIAETGT